MQLYMLHMTEISFKLKAQKQECIVLLNGHYLSSSLLPSLICLLHLNLMLERLKWEKERKRRPYWNGTEKKMDFSFRWHLTNIWHQNVCAIYLQYSSESQTLTSNPARKADPLTNAVSFTAYDLLLGSSFLSLPYWLFQWNIQINICSSKPVLLSCQKRKQNALEKLANPELLQQKIKCQNL